MDIKGVGKAQSGVYHLVNAPIEEIMKDVKARHEKLVEKMKNLSPNVSKPCVNHVVRKNNFVLWHNRLGHASLSRIKHIECISDLTHCDDVCLTCRIASS